MFDFFINFTREKKNRENKSYNRIVGNPLIPNSVATVVNLVQSIRPTLTGILPDKD